MQLRHLVKLYEMNPTLIVEIFSNSYSGYCIRAKQGDNYQALKGWFGKIKTFHSVEEAKHFLQSHTPIHYVYLVQSLAQDEVDPKKEHDYDLHNKEEPGIKINLQHD